MLGNPVFLALQPLLWCGAGSETVTLFALVSSLKAIRDFAIGRILGTGQKVSSFIMAPFKDIVIGLVWFVPILDNTVTWRGNRYRIGRDSLLAPYHPYGIRSWSPRLVTALKTKLAFARS